MTEIASHRGGALLWPENSRIAFENTARLPVEQVEFDIHPSRDGVLVVIHDATLDRTTDGQGPVAEKDWAELQALTLKQTGGQRMLTLPELIDIFRPTAIAPRLEIKADHQERRYPGLEAKVIDVLTAEGVLERAIVTSFQADTVAEVAALTKGRAGPRGLVWLVSPQVRDSLGLARCIAVARDCGATGIGIRESRLDPAQVDAIRDHGLSPGCWACNTQATIARALELGVDVFTTDRPDIALRLRGA